MNPLPIDFDTRWKEIIEASFEDFVAFFLPTLYPDIDFTKKPQFLEQELHKLLAENIKKGKKITDKLVRVFTKRGKENAIFIHVEVEVSGRPVFSERMFKYFYRIFDKKKVPLTAIAIFIGTNHPKAQNTFTYNFHGTRITYEYNTYRIGDQSEENLLASDNPFALVVLANLYALKTKDKYEKRLAFKIQLLEVLKKRNYSRKKIVDLIIFMKVVLALPEDFEESFEEIIMSKLNNPQSDMLALIRPEEKAFYAKVVDALYGTDTAVKMEQYKAAERQLQETLQEKEEIEQKNLEIEQKNLEIQQKNLEIQQKNLEIEQKNQKLEQSLLNTIYRLYSQANHSSKEIASFLDVPESYIHSILKEKGLLD